MFTKSADVIGKEKKKTLITPKDFSWIQVSVEKQVKKGEKTEEEKGKTAKTDTGNYTSQNQKAACRDMSV